MTWVRFLAGARDLSLLCSVQNCSVAHPAFCPMGTDSSFPGDKATGVWSWPLTSIWCQGQEWWGYTSTSPNLWCLIKHTDKCTVPTVICDRWKSVFLLQLYVEKFFVEMHLCCITWESVKYRVCITKCHDTVTLSRTHPFHNAGACCN
jgi:hypothetical protein